MIAKEIFYGGNTISQLVSIGICTFNNIFYENINQEHKLRSVERIYVVKILCQASLPLFLT